MILITGGNGQLGTELRHLLKEHDIAYTATDTNALDITDKSSVDAFFDANRPDIVYNCAAYTAVDKEEDEGKVLGEKINVDGTRNIAQACARIGAVMVQISTDYGFGGYLPVGKEWNEDGEKKQPVSEYGRTKDLGEQAIEASGANYYVIRTAWLFGNYGPNFVFTMQKLAETHPELTVVNDQHGVPTWSRTLAEFMLHLVETKAAYGFYHLTNDKAANEDVTWFDFATEILKKTDTKVVGVSSENFAAKAKRPFNSTMSLKKAKATGFDIPTWQEALAQMLKQGDLRADKDKIKGEASKK
jgi:dTDP-4-dehydrorhamnose reductase